MIIEWYKPHFAGGEAKSQEDGSYWSSCCNNEVGGIGFQPWQSGAQACTLDQGDGSPSCVSAASLPVRQSSTSGLASYLLESSRHLTAKAPLSFLLLVSSYSGCPHRRDEIRVWQPQCTCAEHLKLCLPGCTTECILLKVETDMQIVRFLERKRTYGLQGGSAGESTSLTVQMTWIQSPRLTCCKERTDSQTLSSDFHTHWHTPSPKEIINHFFP